MSRGTLFCVGALGLAAVAGCGSSSSEGPLPQDSGSTADGDREGAAPADATSDAGSGTDSSDGGTRGDAPSGDASSSARSPQATTYFGSVLNLTPGLCLAFPLSVEANGFLSCQMFYVLALGDTCAAHPGLSPAAPDVSLPPVAPQMAGMAVCILPQLPSSQTVSGSCATSSQPGWCYVSGAAASPCPEALVVSPAGALPAGAFAVLGCDTPAPIGPFSGASDPAAVGVACTPSPEKSATFAGFDSHTVVLDEGNPACGADVCLVNHFAGRTTCAYGQDGNGNAPPGVPACTVPGTNTPVLPAVDGGALDETVRAQCTSRRSKDTVYCSCRCANGDGRSDDGANYCSCPSGYACAQVVPLLQPGDPRAGAYCIPDGTEYQMASFCSPCNPLTMSCP